MTRAFAFALLLSSAVVSAADWYVDGAPQACGGAGCSDTNDGQTEASAFATPQGCIDRMQSGDTCWLKTATYVGQGPNRYTPHWNFCSAPARLSGTPGSPTSVRALPGHRPRFCTNASCTSTNVGPLIGATSLGTACRDLHFEGLHVVGGFAVWGDNDTVGRVRITGNEFEGGSDCDGNWAPVRLENVFEVRFDHNYVHRFDHSGCTPAANSWALVKSFCVRDSLFENNTLDGTDRVSPLSHGFDDKDTSLRNTYRYNLIVGVGQEGIRIGHQRRCGPAMEDVQVLGNVFVGSSVRGILEVDRLRVQGNTFVASPGPFFGNGVETNGFTNAVLRDNVFASVAVEDGIRSNIVLTAGQWAQLTAGWTMDFNVYDANAVYAQNRYGPGEVRHADLAAWRTASGKDATSREAVCAFVDGGVGRPFTLAAADPCRSFATDGGEVGAFALTDCVGHLCGAQPAPSDAGTGGGTGADDAGAAGGGGGSASDAGAGGGGGGGTEPMAGPCGCNASALNVLGLGLVAALLRRKRASRPSTSG